MWRDDFSCLTELDVFGEDGKPLTKDTWKVVYASTEEEANAEGYADYLIDGDLGTYWHSQWSGEKTQHPHRVIIDLGEIMTIKGVRLRLRNKAQAGVVKDFRLYGRPQFFLFK